MCLCCLHEIMIKSKGTFFFVLKERGSSSLLGVKLRISSQRLGVSETLPRRSLSSSPAIISFRPFTLFHPHTLNTHIPTTHTTQHSIVHFLSWSQGPPYGTQDKQEAASQPSTSSHTKSEGKGGERTSSFILTCCPWSSYGPSSMLFWPPSSPLGTSCHRPPRSMTLSRPTLSPSKYKELRRV